LTAGPAISNTKATPGVRPFSISDRAMGMEPVAQIYMGTAITTTASMASRGYRARPTKRSSGTNTVMRAAMISPITSHLPMLSTMLMKP